jgi:hypothetical protein
MDCARYVAVFTLVLAMALNAWGDTQSTTAVDPASWVPADALAYVGVSDVEKLGEEIRGTAFYKLMQDPRARESWGRASLPSKFYEALKARLAQVLDVEPGRLRNPFGGPAAMYFAAANDEGRDEFRPVFVAGIGDATLMRDYYDRVTRKFREVADDHDRISFGSYTIERFTTRSRAVRSEQQDPNDEGLGEAELGFFDTDEESLASVLNEVFGRLFSAEAMPERLALCLTADRLIVAPTAEHVTDVLQREQGGASLVDTEAYQTLLRQFEPLGSVRWLVNLAKLFEAMEATEGQEARAALAMLGAASMRSLIGHVLFDDNDFESKLEALLLLSGERTGLAKIFSMENRPLVPPPSVSADNFLYASVNANVPEVLDEIERMIRLDDPDAADQLRARLASMELPEGETLSLRKELLEKLRGPLTFALAFQRPYGPRSARLQLTLGHSDKPAIDGFLEKVSSAFGGMMMGREAGGALLYDLSYGGFSLVPTDQAIIAGTTNTVEAALQASAPARSLAADPTFKRAAALAPSEAWAVVYVDSRRMFEAGVEMARNKDALTAAQFRDPANLIALGIVEALTTRIDQDQVDAARQLARYQAPNIIAVATTPAGIRLTQIRLRPRTD